ncbi:MAG: AAA family ATPase [Propionibacteriaceae bacterium]|nr:AAA family ATPase [Propionibacteriaceae bacterium]
MTEEIADSPCVVRIRRDGTGEVTIMGTVSAINCPDLATARREAITLVAGAANGYRRSMPVLCTEPEGVFRLVVNPDGTVDTISASSPEPMTDDSLSVPARAVTPEPPPLGIPTPEVADTTQAVTSQAAPTCAVFLRANGAGEVLINNRATSIASPDLPSARRQSMEVLMMAARAAGTTLLAVCSDPEGLFKLLISPDGTVTEASQDAVAPQPTRSAFTSVPLPPQAPPVQRPSMPVAARALDPGDDLSFQSDMSTVPRRAFTATLEGPLTAEQGWRGALVRRGFSVRPSEAERTDRAHRAAVSQYWPDPRTVSVVNGKGGAGKTPTTICLAAVFARFGGANVLAWDNNQTRGTLGWRTEQGPHEATLLELLPQVPYLMSGHAQTSDLVRFIHHQSRDHFDVLRSKSALLADEQRITPQDVDAIWRVATKYYQLVIMDSGNDESDPMWRRMIDYTNQLVTVTTTRADHAEAGALLLEALARRNEHGAELAQNSVTIITLADPKASDESIRRIRDGYAALSRDVVIIPYDPAMVEGALLYDNLKPATQRAWLAAAASVADGFF